MSQISINTCFNLKASNASSILFYFILSINLKSSMLGSTKCSLVFLPCSQFCRLKSQAHLVLNDIPTTQFSQVYNLDRKPAPVGKDMHTKFAGGLTMSLSLCNTLKPLLIIF